MYNRNNRRGMSRRSSYRITAANNVEKAIALLLSAEYKTSKNNDIYDFLYGSWSLGEAEQLANKRQVVQALRHYENLEYEMDYKSRKLNEGLRGRRSATRKIAWSKMDWVDLIDFAKQWSSLGRAVTEQVEQITSRKEIDFEEVNPAAIKLAWKTLRLMHEDLDEIFEEYINWYEGNYSKF